VKNVKLYLLALVFTLVGWVVMRVNKYFTFSVPTRIVVKALKNDIFFQKDTLVQLNISAKGYAWLKKLRLDTLQFFIKQKDAKIFSSGDSIMVRFTAILLQEKLDSLLGEGFKIVNISDVFAIKSLCILQKKIPLAISVFRHPQNDCFLCGNVSIEPAYVIVEGTPSSLAKFDRLDLQISPTYFTNCVPEKLLVKLPDRKEFRYHFPSPAIVRINFPFCRYQHVQLERFYRFTKNDKTFEGVARIKAFIPPAYPFDSIQIVVEFLDEKHVRLKLKNDHLFKQVIIEPEQIELK